MERLVRKYEQSFRRAKEEMITWGTLQASLLKQFGNAAAILERLPVLIDSNNYGVLAEEKSMAMVRGLPAAQVESLELTFRAMTSTLSELKRVKNSLEKLWRDGQQLVRAEKNLTPKQLQQRVGPRPSLQDCTDGLYSLYQMHCGEYNLKVALVSALSYDIKSQDMILVQTLLSDEPNIPSNEVQHILDLISAGDGK
ncbi:unnamed protein product [Calypogeia fissa]